MLLELLQVKGRLVVRAGFSGNEVGRMKTEPPIHRHETLGRNRPRGKGRGHGTKKRQGHRGTGTLEESPAVQRMFCSDMAHVTCSRKFQIE